MVLLVMLAGSPEERNAILRAQRDSVLINNLSWFSIGSLKERSFDHVIDMNQHTIVRADKYDVHEFLDHDQINYRRFPDQYQVRPIPCPTCHYLPQLIYHNGRYKQRNCI